MDLTATLATAIVFLTLGAFGYSRLRKPAASNVISRGEGAEQARRRKVRTIQGHIAHDKRGL